MLGVFPGVLLVVAAAIFLVPAVQICFGSYRSQGVHDRPAGLLVLMYPSVIMGGIGVAEIVFGVQKWMGW